MARGHGFRTCLLRTCGVAVVACVVLAIAPGGSASVENGVRMWQISYPAHNGVSRRASVVLPAWYGPERNPLLPLVISPHGRGATGAANARFWGDMPAVGGFAVISPDGMGRRLAKLSYGYARQIDDLARMPDLATAELPWLRIDRSRIYALGTSMGGQETLLLVARYPRLLAGAVAMDSVTDLARRYGQLPDVPCSEPCRRRWGGPYGRVLQAAMRKEVGGTPQSARHAYAARSAITQVHRIAASGVALQIWWSSGDQIVFDQAHQSALLDRELRRARACGPLVAYSGTWRHSQAMWAGSLLPVALAGFGLLPSGFPGIPDGHFRSSCVPSAGLSGIPRIIAKGMRCRSTPGACA
jgi:pimeloyl-ACP methyl ester carboxylesterase